MSRLIDEMRQYDLEAYKYSLDTVEAGNSFVRERFYSDFIFKFIPRWAEIERKINRIYIEENY